MDMMEIQGHFMNCIFTQFLFDVCSSDCEPNIQFFIPIEENTNNNNIICGKLNKFINIRKSKKKTLINI